MRTLFLTLAIFFIGNTAFSQVTDKRNVFDEKGDFYFYRGEYEKAIVYYNMAYVKDINNIYSILQKAEAYKSLELYAQAIECYRIAFKKNPDLDNTYRLDFALVLYKNKNLSEFRKWINAYNKYVEDEVAGTNYISSMDNRVKLYKDTSIVLSTPVNELDKASIEDLDEYKAYTFKESEIIPGGFSSSVSFSAVNSTGTLMVFASDAPGGNGGMDLYVSYYINDSWSAPKNLGGEVNSSKDETYPSIVNDSILYFTSDGHGGFGGSDIFRVNLNDDALKILNLGKNINTAADEYALKLNTLGQSGYYKSEDASGKEKIFSVEVIDSKIKYSGFQYRRRHSMESDKINLYIENGNEYNISSSGSDGYKFSFLPLQNYKLVIQRENIKAEDVLYSKKLTDTEKDKLFLNPPAVDKAEIELEAGLKYEFISGNSALDAQYLKSLDEMTAAYQKPQTGTINLTALAKELKFVSGEVYTIRFERDKTKLTTYKGNGESALSIQGEEVMLYGQSFFIVLPLKEEMNFNVQTDLSVLKENFNPKKYALFIDKGELFSGANWFISLAVNTDKTADVKPENQLTSQEISILPGTEYILSLSKPDPATGENIEIIVPLTKGVKYDLNSLPDAKVEFKETLTAFLTGREGLQPKNEEIIDISILSKELEIKEGEELSFTLIPAKKFGKAQEEAMNVVSSITLDNQTINFTGREKYTINVPFTAERKMNIQTDIKYVQDNFDPASVLVSIDTLSFFSEITIDTTGLGERRGSGWLSMNVNTESEDEVDIFNQLTAREVSIIPGKEYILTVSKVDAETGKLDEIIVPLTREVKYDFTSKPQSAEEYKKTLNRFIEGQEEFETIEGELIDINLLSKALEINEGDEVSFSLLPVKDITKKTPDPVTYKSSLYLDSKIVEFTQIQKYTINVPLSEQKMNIQTDIEYVEKNFDPGTFTLDLDTASFFSEITVDTTGYGDRIYNEEEITDPVFDVVVVNFDLNAHNLSQDAMQTINKKVVEQLKADKRLYVTIKGYTDALGNADYNLQLSKRRAESVQNYLNQNGIGSNRIRTFSFGASQALKEGINWADLNEEELKKYRKVEIVIYLPE
ncbi:MAG: OmpA family protein [Bacteroidales bacterium]|nr:OmpA family protein [Bacteroidales bacterium]MBN2818961.1 OmpA family protein [Bacteroidales bacterium]